MTKHDEGRRAFLVGTAVGAGAAASAALVPEALAKTGKQHHAAADAPAMATDRAADHAMGDAHGAFFNDDDSRTVAAFAERLMPGAPGKSGATDAGVLNYIDLALAGAYSVFLPVWACATRRSLHQSLQQAVPQADGGTAGRDHHCPRAGQGGGIRLAERTGILQHSANAHDGRYVRRPDLWG